MINHYIVLICFNTPNIYSPGPKPIEGIPILTGVTAFVLKSQKSYSGSLPRISRYE